MQLKVFLKGAITAGMLALTGAGSALAQASCTETQFNSKTGQLYLEAEQAAITNKDFDTALAKINQLRTMALNCYEESAIIRISAYIKIEKGDRQGAVRDLLDAINKGYVPPSDIAQTYYNIAQIYLQMEDIKSALDYMQKWQAAGGKPDRTQKWQLAVLYQRVDNFREAIRYAEEVRRDDGAKFDQPLYDLLVFLYNESGNKAKLAEVLEVLVERKPAERKYWDAIAGNYFQGDDIRKAFEVQKAMYFAGLLKTEDELMRIVNFYNQLNAPYYAAKVLEKEMNAGRIKKTVEKMSLLADFYQVAREHEKAIPVIRQAAEMGGGGAMYERLGASYSEIGKWKETEDALLQALKLGGVKDRGTIWVRIGQSRFERGDRAGAREAFREAGNSGGRGWLEFMRSEEETKDALVCFEVQASVLNLVNEDKICKKLSGLGESMPEGCKTVADRLKAGREKFTATPQCRNAQPV
ncbi:MAG: tetratricopeptide repeat protein [Hyphomonas sp.]